MITFTKEQLIASAHARIEFAEMMLSGELEPLKERTWSIELELARIALASLEAEPGADTDVQVYVPVYTSPPAPVVMDEAQSRVLFEKWCSVNIDRNKWHPEHYAHLPAREQWDAWEACRDAMLQGAEPLTTAYKLPEETGSSPQLRNLIRQRHAEWSQSTFGDVGPVGPLKHLSKEALEAAAEPGDLSEWADMQFLLWDAQRRAGITDEQITQAMIDKLEVNKARQWPEPRDGEPRLHIKPTPKQEEKQCT